MNKFVIAIGLLLSCMTNAEPRDQEVVATLHRFLEGVDQIEVHDSFWAEELIYTSSSGARFGKATIIDGMAAESDSSNSKISPSYTAFNPVVRFLGDTAVLTFELQMFEGDSATPARRFYNTGVLIERDGRWQAMTWQATVIPSE